MEQGQLRRPSEDYVQRGSGKSRGAQARGSAPHHQPLGENGCFFSLDGREPSVCQTDARNIEATSTSTRCCLHNNLFMVLTQPTSARACAKTSQHGRTMPRNEQFQTKGYIYIPSATESRTTESRAWHTDAYDIGVGFNPLYRSTFCPRTYAACRATTRRIWTCWGTSSLGFESCGLQTCTAHRPDHGQIGR